LKPKKENWHNTENVFLTGTDDEMQTKPSTKQLFFHTMGMDTKLSDYTKDFDKTANFIVNRFEERGWV
jgi:NADP-dependent alcohol dehydrogenase